eukprot:TRINITY_DN22319_c0_g1_i1.p1 TRINITY_DN22319_c0_g1~~TRINITY_DN22319_c0_g1_i1.p1  ORF type:complete len:136 (+),score=46.36 TRINITY_DN22319_c0_g1_i1:77-484(+)
MIRRPPRSTQSRSSAASDVYKRQYQRRVRGRLEQNSTFNMGKGDIKSKRGKISSGTYGARRQKKKVAAYVAPVVKEKPAAKEKVEEPKKAAAKKPAAKKAAAKKPAAKKAAVKKPAAKKAPALSLIHISEPTRPY